MIKISNLTKKYNNDVVALNGVTLSVDKGDIYGIIGLSGAGKSTLVRCINLLEQPTSGTIEIDGVDLTKLSKKDLRVKRKEISMIFQNFNLLQQKNVLQNVLFPLQISNNDKQYSLKKAKELGLEVVQLFHSRTNSFYDKGKGLTEEGHRLLHELLEHTNANIYCIIREKDNIDSIERFKQKY